ncbi:SecY-interacting protein [Shewanella sp. AS1]|uniref:SecY-interacting protein n=1 Tax=Shewanella sp. AS1 TaxID=2907626 RepID=UPI001F4555F8|nr:SecY-interacting protein [Shewanella sp. AS1]MCE9678143.1 SecY-interacting protein [Shewanella sp. AS1]
MSSLPALEHFFEQYHEAYLDKLGEHPKYYPHGEDSLCLFETDKAKLKQDDIALQWQVVKRESPGSFANIETALSIQLHPSIQAFYGHYFAASLMFNAKWGEGELLQVWNQNDFEYLQQNLIGHLMMKQKLKQEATWFIGVLGEGDQMLVVDNRDGSVWVEVPGEVPQQRLADSLDEFISQLTPRVCPPTPMVEESLPALDHPGIWQRIKIMWRHLTNKV